MADEPDFPTGPPARGSRLPWSAMPAAVLRALQERLGSGVAEAETQPGGFSPAVAAKVRLADGRRGFVKAAGPEPNPDAPGFYRQEARIAGALPASAPAPRLLLDFEEDGWVVLVFEDLDGDNPRVPWDPQQLRRVLDAVADLAVALTPAPIDAPPIADALRDQFEGWRSFAADYVQGRRLAPWIRDRVDELADLEARWEAAADGPTLLHADLRADNVVLTSDGVYFVDWPWACVGVAWIDLLFMLPSVAMQGGPEPDEIFDHHAVAREASGDAVNAVLAGLSGFFLWKGSQPPPPGLPTVRAFQQAQGIRAVRWLLQRLG